MPDVFAGDPTAVNIGGGKALRTIQWGNDVFVAGNFSATSVEAVTVPSGTWYNYYLQSKQTESTIVLQPGELVILTGSQQQLPKIPNVEDLANGVTAVEDITVSAPVQKFIYNGTLYLRRGNRTYTVDGQLVQ